MLEDFAERRGVALVAGGSGGIGSAIVRRLSEEGAHVVFTYFSTPPDEVLDSSLGVTEAVRVDLTDSAAVQAMVDSTLTRHGAIHTLVYAAGPHVPMIHLSRVTPEEFARQVDRDLIAFFSLVHAAIPALRETSGSVVAVTTAATRRYPVRDGLSAGPKGGVEALARGFAAEEGRFGIRVNCVGPGMLSDGMSARLMDSNSLDERALRVAMGNIPLRKFGTSTDIAEAVVFLASDRAQFITGQKLDVDGGYGV